MENSQEKKSRPRGENWTQEEKDIFLEIMKQSVPIIECKRIDTKSNNLKALEWGKFHRKFRKISGKKREIHQLKNFWKRLKMAAAKKVLEHKKTAENTGGGGVPPLADDDLKIMDLLCQTKLGNEEKESDSNEIMFLDTDETSESSETQAKISDTEYDMEMFEIIDDQDERIPELTAEDITPKKEYSNGESKQHKVKNFTKEAIIEANKYIRKNSMQSTTTNMMEEEHRLKMEYQRRELAHQKLRHKIEIEILLLDKEKKELELKQLEKRA